MIFNSLTYLVFLAIVIPLYWVLPSVARLWFVFISSMVFYGFWRIEYLALMLFSAGVDYYAAILIHATPNDKVLKRRCLLGLTLATNLGLLFYFKYLFFVVENANCYLRFLGFVGNIPAYQVLLPFGISFYTFETISYTVDVYRGLIKPERRFIHYALFVTFVPKLVAGPIQRAGELIEQLKRRTPFRIEFIDKGIRRILYGLFIKVFLADTIGIIVDDGFSIEAHKLFAIDVLTLSFLFGFQIYFDFSAYSHIALGTAKLMGIDIPENFNFPYIAASLKDFWKRWHISLSSWIRDYLYLPLCGAKVATASGKEGIGGSLEVQGIRKRNVALFLTWGIMGMWHGANWTFLVWGLYHAFFIFSERALSRLILPLPKVLIHVISHFVTLLVVMLSWIPFRARSLEQTIELWKKLFEFQSYFAHGLHENTYLVAALVLLLFYISFFAQRFVWPLIAEKQLVSFGVNVVILSTVLLVIFTYLRPVSQFIYFQF